MVDTHIHDSSSLSFGSLFGFQSLTRNYATLTCHCLGCSIDFRESVLHKKKTLMVDPIPLHELVTSSSHLFDCLLDPNFRNGPWMLWNQVMYESEYTRQLNFSPTYLFICISQGGLFFKPGTTSFRARPCSRWSCSRAGLFSCHGDNVLS